MNIFNPQILWLLLLVIPVLFLLIPLYHYQKKNFFLLGGRQEKEPIFQQSFLTHWSLLILFYIFVVLAWSDISVGNRAVRRSVTGLEVALVMDISNSMLAADLAPSRLAVNESLARDVIYGLHAAKIGIVFFKGEAIIASPLTEDKNFLTGIIANADPKMLTAKGTSIAAGLVVAKSLFSVATDIKKVILLLSDGADLNGDLLASLRSLGTAGITVLSVGVATNTGIELPNFTVGNKPVYTKLEEASLRSAAQATSGMYFPYQNNTSTQIINYLSDYKKTTSHLEHEPNRLSTLFILFALVSLLLSVWFRSAQWKKCYSLS